MCFENERFLSEFESKWAEWKTKDNVSNITKWWINTKPKIKKLIIKLSFRIKNE